MIPQVRLRLFVACERADIDAETGDVHPFIAGAINESVWMDDPDAADSELGRLKTSFDPEGACEWREVWAVFSQEQLRQLFAVSTVVGVIPRED